LFRSSFFSFDLEIELAHANIPFQKFGGMKFVETAHIKDGMAFLRIAGNPKDVISWYRVLLMHEGIGPKTAQKILDELSLGRLTISKEPDEQQDFKLRKKLPPLFYLLYNLHKKNKMPSELVQMNY